MTGTQILFAIITTSIALFGSSWIIAQSLSRARTTTQEFQERMVNSITGAVQAVAADRKVPEYENRFAEGAKRMDELARQMETLQSDTRKSEKEMAVQVHSVNNLKQRFEAFEYALKGLRDKIDEMPDKIVKLLEARRA